MHLTHGPLSLCWIMVYHCTYTTIQIQFWYSLKADSCHPILEILYKQGFILFFTDEVGALVFDIGSYSFRAGFAGEDTPKVCTFQTK